MKNMKNTIVCICSVLMLAGSGITAAACSQSDAKGTWRVHMMIWDIAFAERPYSVACKLKVGSGGSISTSKSVCKVYGVATVPLLGGKLVMDSQCGMKGKMSTPAGPVKIRSGRMDRSKNSFTALGVDPGDSNSEMFLQAVRQ